MYKKYMSKATAIILTAAMAVCAAGCAQETGEDAMIEDVITSESDEEAALEKTITNSSFAGRDAKEGKVETVYVTTDPTGAVNDVIVSDWIRNTDGSDEINDVTDLENIVNVKGRETYTANDDGTISWNANGADIYYQGYSEAELPVDVHVTYTLDGEEISPYEIAGKSGHVGIRFDYTNNAKETIEIAGDQTEVYVPFAMVSGLMLDSSKFTNVEVTGGKAISDGNNIVVVGVALPGLKESLDLDEEKLDQIDGLNADIAIPDHVDIEADTTDFELGMTLTMASSDVLEDLGLTGLADEDAVEDIENNMSLISDGAGRLVNGAGALKDGVDDLKEGTSALFDGSKDLYDGTVALSDGAGQLYDGVSAYTSGASQINDGAAQLADGAKTLADGANDAKNGSAQLRSAMETGDIVGNANALASGAAQVSEGAGSLASGLTSLKDGAASVSAGASSLSDNMGQIQAGVLALEGAVSGASQTTATAVSGAGTDIGTAAATLQTLLSSETMSDTDKAVIMQALGSLESAGTTLSALSSGGMDASQIEALNAGLDAAVSGAQALAAGASQVSDGASQVSDGAGSLAAGASQVADGAGALAGGIGQVYGGVVALDDGLGNLASGAGQLSTGAGDLYNGTSTLVSNNDSLLGGAGELKSGANTLSDGARTLSDGAGALDDGAGQLSAGVNELADGIVKFDEEGVEKLSDAFDGSIDGFMQRISAVDKAGKEYTSFAGRSDDMSGSVKFIIKTGAVKSII